MNRTEAVLRLTFALPGGYYAGQGVVGEYETYRESAKASEAWLILGL